MLSEKQSLHIQKLARLSKGKPNPHKGRPHTEETKLKISLAKKGIRLGVRQTPEWIKKRTAGMKGRVFSEESRRKMSLGQKNRNLVGSNNPAWRGGVNKSHERLRRGIDYKLWREAVFRRDNWTCVQCGARSCKGNTIYLNADHIKQFCDFPELRYSVENGRTLCIVCHKKTDSYGYKTFNERRRNGT